MRRRIVKIKELCITTQQKTLKTLKKIIYISLNESL